MKTRMMLTLFRLTYKGFEGETQCVAGPYDVVATCREEAEAVGLALVEDEIDKLESARLVKFEELQDVYVCDGVEVV